MNAINQQIYQHAAKFRCSHSFSNFNSINLKNNQILQRKKIVIKMFVRPVRTRLLKIGDFEINVQHFLNLQNNT